MRKLSVTAGHLEEEEEEDSRDQLHHGQLHDKSRSRDDCYSFFSIIVGLDEKRARSVSNLGSHAVLGYSSSDLFDG